MSYSSTPGYSHLPGYGSSSGYGYSSGYGHSSGYDSWHSQPPSPALPPMLPSNVLPHHTSVHYGPVSFGNRDDSASVTSRSMAPPPPPPPKPAQPLPGWEEIMDPSTGRHYYHNTTNGNTQWDPPTKPAAGPLPQVPCHRPHLRHNQSTVVVAEVNVVEANVVEVVAEVVVEVVVTKATLCPLSMAAQLAATIACKVAASRSLPTSSSVSLILPAPSRVSLILLT